MQYAHPSGLYGGCRVTGLDTLTAGFGKHNPHPVVVNVVIDSAGGIAPATHAGHQHIGIVAACLLLQLFLDFLRDDALQARHHVGVGVWTYGAAYNIKSVGRMAAPVADGFVGGILQRPVAGLDGTHLGPQHLHPLYVDMLALHVQRSLIHHARHVHQRTHRCRCHAVLAGTRLSDDTLLAHLLGKQYLTDGVVDLVSTRVVKVFAFQVKPTAVFLAHTLGMIERRRASYIVA